MTWQAKGRQLAEMRRDKIARIRLDCPGIQQRQVRQKLTEDGFINPKTQQPFSVGAIAKDYKVLDAQWRAERLRDLVEHGARQLAELQDLRSKARKEGDLRAALTALELEMKLLGTAAPTKIAPTTPDGSDEYTGLSDAERSARLVAFFDAARARRDLQVAQGGTEGESAAEPA